MNFLKLLAFLIVSTLVGITQAQSQAPVNVSDLTKPVQILPPAPNAASLGKYGGIDIGLSSGTPNINIPIFNYETSNLALPISLNYTSNGFKVDEIASRVGIGWSLNAGGVITRTVYGSVDEQSTRLTPKVLPSNNTLLELLKSWSGGDDPVTGGGVGPYGTYDNQPDIFHFNFNGYTGSFILDSTLLPDGTRNMQPVLLSHSNLKIERSLSGNNDYAFKCTTGDGVAYLFKTGDFTTSYNPSNLSTTGCGFNYNQSVTTSYYLDKVIHPNNDTITLSYSRSTYHYLTSVSETIYKNDPADADNSGCQGALTPTVHPTLENTMCFSELQTDGALLKEIKSSTGGKIKFNYVNRNDYNDSLLSYIEIFQPNATTPFKTFNFGYYYPSNSSYYTPSNSQELHYRPFLISVSESGTSGAAIKMHIFGYNDIESLPFRLSFAKDHWGYFNGKNNSTSIPTPTDEKFKYYLPLATANREADPEFARKGLLAFIMYPTGGKDSILYEGNLVNALVEIKPQPATVTMNASSSPNPTYSSNITVSFTQMVTICGSRSFAYPGDTSTYVNIRVLDANSNVFFAKTLLTQGENSFSTNVYLNPGTYKIELKVLGYNSTGSACMTYIPGNSVVQNQNVYTGGVRVAKVLTYDGNKPSPTIKKYIYNVPAFFNYKFNYQKELKVYIVCPSGYLDIGCVGTASYNFFTMYSNSIFSIYQNQNAPVSYASVKESYGENFENGGIEHSFTVAADYPANSAVNIYNAETIIGAPNSRLDFRNGQETCRYTFKTEGGIFKPVQKIYTHFKEDSSVATSYRAYVSNRKYSYPCPILNGTPSDSHWKQYDCMSYDIYRSWIYADSIRTLTYDELGENYSEQVALTEYANNIHVLPTKITTIRSDNTVNITNNYYPNDLVLSGNDETARQALITKHIISPVLRQDVFKGTIPVLSSITKYNIFSTGLVLPQSKWFKLGSNSFWENSDVFYQYNLKGKLLEQGKQNDVHTTYVWGYNSNFPLAAINGSNYSTISSLIDQSILDNPISDQALRTELKKIRTGLNGTKALISTYTYLPFVGMTSQTDVKGMTTYYDYDSFSRLKNIRDNDSNIIKRYDYEYSNFDVATSVIEMQNFAGNNTIGYPVGVFDINGGLIGNATNPNNYVTLWNGNSANALIGTLSTISSSPLKFKLQLNTGQTAPKNVTGCRYYQYDIEYFQIDGIINPNGCFVDFGDSSKMRLGKSKFDVSGIVLPANTAMSLFAHPYFIHTYYVGSSTTLDNSLHTITIYHNDGSNESPFMDNRYSPAESLKRLKNLRGTIPQNVENFGASCFQQATALNETNITNWNSINSIKSWVMNIGDDQTAATNLSYSQDFLKNNKGLNEIQATREDYFKAGYLDASFKLTKLKSDWNTYFTELASILIREEHWNHENLSALVKLKNFLLVAANTNHSNTQSGNSIIDITPQNIDKVINEIAAGAGTNVYNGFITILSGTTTRTSSSDAAISLLKSKGWVIKIKGVSQ